MKPEQTQKADGRVALFVRGDFFWLLGQQGQHLTTTVRKEHAQSPLLSEACLSEEHAAARFDHMLMFSRGHDWTPFYVGPRLEG